jgi:hypothetical protein
MQGRLFQVTNNERDLEAFVRSTGPPLPTKCDLEALVRSVGPLPPTSAAWRWSSVSRSRRRWQARRRGVGRQHGATTEVELLVGRPPWRIHWRDRRWQVACPWLFFEGWRGNSLRPNFDLLIVYLWICIWMLPESQFFLANMECIVLVAYLKYNLFWQLSNNNLATRNSEFGN